MKTYKNIVIDIESILERINSNDHTYINDHNGMEKIMDGYLIIDNEYICPIIKDTIAYSISPLYIRLKDDRIHLAKPSVAGTIFNTDFNSPEEAVTEYQKRSNETDHMRKVTDYKFF